MNADIFAEWLRRQGFCVVRTDSSYWFNQGPRVYQAFPYHWVIEPSQDEIKQLLRENHIIGIRYSTHHDADIGHASYHVMYESEIYEMSLLPKKARHDVKKGLKHTEIQQIPLARLADEGWALRQDTLRRQNREKSETRQWWYNLCQSAEGLPGFEAWAAIHEGKLTAALLAFTCEDCCSILFQQSAIRHLSYGVNNALTFTFTQTVLHRTEVSRVFYGLHSLDAPPSVDEFKFRMGYTANPVRQRVVFHPWIAPLFNSVTHRVVKAIAKWKPENPLLAKTEGLIRFYREGKLPLEEQSWPPVLVQKTAKN